MLKSMVVATAALAIAGSSNVYAQQRFGGPGDYGASGPRFEQCHRLSADDMKAFADARIAALKAGLELTPDQAKNWPAFEQALRNMSQLRIQHIQHMQQRMQAREAAPNQETPAPASPFDRLAHRADHMAKVSAALKQVADTGAPLYQSLNDAQKHRFTILAHLLRPHWLAGGHFWQEHHGHGMMDRGDWGEGGMHGMIGPDRDNGGHGMMGRDFGESGPHGMMGPDRDSGGQRMMGGDFGESEPHGMMGPESDQDSGNL